MWPSAAVTLPATERSCICRVAPGARSRLANVRRSAVRDERRLSRRAFVAAGAPEKGVGQRFETEDGRAILSVYSRDNEHGETPAGYLKNNLRIDRDDLDYERTTRSFFAISLERDGLIFYSRCNFSGRREGAIHCFDLVYPHDEKRAWDQVVTRISLSLRPKEG